jgi:hypothetical protein
MAAKAAAVPTRCSEIDRKGRSCSKLWQIMAGHVPGPALRHHVPGFSWDLRQWVLADQGGKR